MDSISREVQRNMTPEEALDRLMEGNRRFIGGSRISIPLISQVKETSSDQFPYAAILACSDSRSPAEHIFHLGIGEIFSVRVAGNIVNRDILGSLEYACNVLGSKLILVLGHTSCGAVTAACNRVKMGNVTSLLSRLTPAIATFGDGPLEVDRVAEQNVWQSIQQIREESSILADMESRGGIIIQGAMYDLSSGRVRLLV
jgi:carbonic anhydrase